MTSYLQRTIDERVAATLASMGADLLSTYGKHREGDDGTPNPMGVLGGYLLERFGKRDTADEPAEPEA